MNGRQSIVWDWEESSQVKLDVPLSLCIIAVVIWWENVPQRFICLKTWFPDDGTVLKACGTFRWWSLAKRKRVIQGGSCDVTAWPHFLFSLSLWFLSGGTMWPLLWCSCRQAFLAHERIYPSNYKPEWTPPSVSCFLQGISSGKWEGNQCSS